MESPQMSPQKRLIQALHERGDQVQQQFYSLITDYKNDIITFQSAHSFVIEILQHDRRSLDLFNQNLPEKYQIRTLGDEKLTEFLNYIIENLEVKGLDPNLLEDLTTLFQVFMESLSTRCFYTYEHLSEAFLEKLLEYEIEKNVLNDELLGLIESAVDAYKDSRPPMPEPIKEEVIIEEEPKIEIPVPQLPVIVEIPKSKKTSITIQPVKEKFSCLDDIKQEHDIIEFLERRLNLDDFASVLNLIYLYYKNIVSYVELIDVGGELFGKLEKDALAILRLSLESREISRCSHNPFIPRPVPMQPSKLNRSYKEIITFDYWDYDSVLNTKFVCLARGAEGGNTGDGGRRHIKNQYEEELLKLEDELHEFDNMIQQFEVFRFYLNHICAGSTSPHKKNEYLKKLLNSKIIFAIYGSKAVGLIGLISNGDIGTLNMLIERFTDQIDKLQKAKSEYRAFWRSSMENIYYRALDVLSNTFKLEEKKIFINKEMIDELKETKKINGMLKLYDSIKMITRERNNHLIPLEPKCKRFFNPAFILKISHKNVLEDAVFILRLWLGCSKLNAAEKDKANIVIAKVLVNYFQIKEKSGKLIADLMNEETDLIAEILDVTAKIEPKSTFKYFNEYDPLINEQKLPELYSLLTSLEPYDLADTGPQENNPSPNSMNIKPENPKMADRVYFGPHLFYLFYRHFFCILERLDMVYNFSQSQLGSDEIYLIFIKLLILNIQGSLSNQHYEDSVKLIVRDKSGLLLNFDKFCQNALKLNFNDEFSNFVLENNKRCFGVPDSEIQRENILFAKSCYKMNEYVIKNLKNKNQSSNTTSYILNANEILKFDLIRNYLIIHKFKNIYQDESRFSDNYQELINTYKGYLYKTEDTDSVNKIVGVSESNIVFHMNHKRKEPIFNQHNQEDIVISARDVFAETKNHLERKIAAFRGVRNILFELSLIK